MKLFCPQCGKAMERPDIDVVDRLVHCTRCDEIFGLPATFEARLEIDRAARGASEVVGEPPGGWRVCEQYAGTSVRWNEWNLGLLGLIFFSVIWNLGTWTLLGALLYAAVMLPDGPPLIVVPLFAFHVLVGFASAHNVLSQLFSRTELWIHPRELAVRRLPLAWRRIDPRDIRELAVRRERGVLRLHARLQTGRSVQLVRSLPTREHGEYLRRLIESRVVLNA